MVLLVITDRTHSFSARIEEVYLPLADYLALSSIQGLKGIEK